MGWDISTGESEAQPGMRTTALILRTLTNQKPKQNSTLTRPGGADQSILHSYVSISERRGLSDPLPPRPE